MSELVIDLFCFDDVEIMPVYENKEDGYCEPVLNLSDPISFWTVYGHRKEGGVTALIDCVDEQSANMAAEILEQALAALEIQEELTSMLGCYRTVAAI
ncbi:MAG: hypothetical protein AB2552_17475 [Candidatus Thiodiazotropha endolucinida]